MPATAAAISPRSDHLPNSENFSSSHSLRASLTASLVVSLSSPVGMGPPLCSRWIGGLSWQAGAADVRAVHDCAQRLGIGLPYGRVNNAGLEAAKSHQVGLIE